MFSWISQQFKIAAYPVCELDQQKKWGNNMKL